MATSLPNEVTVLLWDVDPSNVDLRVHGDYVIERVMSRGGWDAMRWLRRTYPDATLADFVKRKGETALAPRERAYWALVTGCDVVVGPGGGRPSWAGP